MAEANAEDPLREDNNPNNAILRRELDLRNGQSVQSIAGESENHTESDFSADKTEDAPNRTYTSKVSDDAHVVGMEDNKSITAEIQGSKTPKLSPIQVQNERKPDPCISPETGGKRRRVQHDYRRLSSSGYVDDYIGRERRFSSTSESEMSLSPTPPKVKLPKTSPAVVADTPKNGIQQGR